MSRRSGPDGRPALILYFRLESILPWAPQSLSQG